MLVATQRCVQMVLIKREHCSTNEFRLYLSKSDLAEDMIHTKGQIRLITEFEKTGRVFCANDSTDGKILEIEFQNLDHTWINKYIYKKDKRMVVQVHNGSNPLLKLMPN